MTVPAIAVQGKQGTMVLTLHASNSSGYYSAMSEPVLNPELAAFIQQGVAIAAGSCDAELHPSMARILACRVGTDRQRITLLLDQHSNQTLLANAQHSQQLAVVFCLPSTERAIQIKGSDIRLEVPLADDPARVAQHTEDFAAEIIPKGYTHAFACGYHEPPVTLVALSFAPRAIFEQTPGPQAGQPLHT